MTTKDGGTDEVVQGMTRALDMMRGGKVDWNMPWDAMAKCEPSKLKEVSYQFWKDAMEELSKRIVEALQSVLEPGSNARCMSVSPSWYTAWKTMQLICSACNSEEEKEELRQMCMHSWKVLFEMLAAATTNGPLARNRGIQKHVNELLRVACAWPSLLERADVMVVLGILRLTIYHHLSSKESHEKELLRVLEMLYFCIRRSGFWFQREVILSMVAAVEAIVDAKEYHQSTFPPLCASVYSCVHSLDKEEGSLLACIELLESMVNFLVEKVGDGQLASSKVFMILLNGGIAPNIWDSLVQRLTDRRVLSQLSVQAAKKKLQTCFLVLQVTRDKNARARGLHGLIQLLRDDVPSPFEIRVDVLKNLSTLCNNLEQETWDVAVRHILQVLLYNPSIRVRRAAMSTCEYMLEQPQLLTASPDLVTEILQVMFLKARDKDKDVRCAAMQSFSYLDFDVVHQSLQPPDWKLLFRHGFMDENTYTPTEQVFKRYCSKTCLIEGLEALGMHKMWEVLRGPLQKTLTPTQLIQAFVHPPP